MDELTPQERLLLDLSPEEREQFEAVRAAFEREFIRGLEECKPLSDGDLVKIPLPIDPIEFVTAEYVVPVVPHED